VNLLSNYYHNEIIPHNSPHVSSDDIKVVSESLRTSWLSQGSAVLQFEEQICKYLSDGKSENQLSGVAVSSGTAALFLALKVLEIDEGSEILVPTYACSALLNAVYMAGGIPVPVDVDLLSFNPTVETCANALTAKSAALILTHTFGVPVDTRKYKELGIYIIEDCCQSIGSRYMDKNVGLEGDLSVFSFYATKMITTGQGGMVVSNDSILMDKVRDLRDFDGRDIYNPSFNFQITDFQASLGISQLQRLPLFISKRQNNTQKYIDAIGDNANDILQLGLDDVNTNCFRFVLKLGSKMEACKAIFTNNGITCVSPIANHELLHRYLKLNIDKFPNAEAISKSVLSIPVFPALTDHQVTRITKVLSNLQI
tara:strand:+ start:2557 stop:3663 length:1107 start_codon:yes stop_codon:yes gene_type:complete